MYTAVFQTIIVLHLEASLCPWHFVLSKQSSQTQTGGHVKKSHTGERGMCIACAHALYLLIKKREEARKSGTELFNSSKLFSKSCGLCSCTEQIPSILIYCADLVKLDLIHSNHHL